LLPAPRMVNYQQQLLCDLLDSQFRG